MAPSLRRQRDPAPPGDGDRPVAEMPLPSIDRVKDLENYRPGGFHPLSIGDSFCGGRYKVLHKLGYGSTSTVWLARDKAKSPGANGLVTLKVMSAAQSSKSAQGVPDLHILRKLERHLQSYKSHSTRETLGTV